MKKTITISVKDCKYFLEVDDYDGDCDHIEGTERCVPEECPIHKEE